jgi:hypothetical protein
MNTEITIPTREQAACILEVVDKGLVRGLGRPTPGEMCVEAAVCFALGLPHNDNPPCVGREVRWCKIALNDKPWSSPNARAKGMRAVAIAQLGSNTIDQQAFKALFWFKCGTQLQPLIGEYYAKGNKNSPHQVYADKMRASTSLKECMDHAYAYVYGYGYGHAYGYGYAYGHAYGYGYGHDVWLTKVADILLECLKELKSPGCQYLDLLEGLRK